MTQTEIEQAAQTAAQNKGLVIGSMTAEVYQEGYKDGVRDALSHQWVSVEERLPEDDRYFYLVADARMNPLGVDAVEYDCKTKLFSRWGKIVHPTHWCAIPPFNPGKLER